VTLKRVAEIAGVSVKTASRALTNGSHVSPATAARVQAAAREVAYVANRAARAMRRGDTDIVGLLSHRLVASPFTTEILRAVEATVEAAGKAVIIADAGPEGVERPLRLLREFQASPVLFAAGYHMSVDHLLPDLFTDGILINCFVADPRLPCLVPDDEGGGHLQARHLLGLGHRRIAMIELPEGLIARRLRRQGVRRAFREAGLDVGAVPCRPGQVAGPEGTRMVAFEAALDLLGAPDRPTALICSKDEYALQAYGVAARLGLRVPEDLSIIGFDDLRLLSEVMRPALTTVRLPYYEMGRLAAEAAVAGVPPRPGIVRVPCPLIERASTAPV
jgi:LacI family transcriptional regulator